MTATIDTELPPGTTERRVIAAVACPLCSSSAGAKCLGSDGATMPHGLHSARLRVYRQSRRRGRPKGSASPDTPRHAFTVRVGDAAAAELRRAAESGERTSTAIAAGVLEAWAKRRTRR